MMSFRSRRSPGGAKHGAESPPQNKSSPPRWPTSPAALCPLFAACAAFDRHPALLAPIDIGHEDLAMRSRFLESRHEADCLIDDFVETRSRRRRGLPQPRHMCAIAIGAFAG